MPILGGLKYGIAEVPWGLIEPHEAQARANHGGQSLERLASRGGLGVAEALDIIEGNRWVNGREEKVVADKLKAYVAKWKAKVGEYTDTQRLDFLMTYQAWVAWNREGDACRVFVEDEEGGGKAPIVGWGADKWSATGREAIDAAMKKLKL
jgi:hypothetical protein